MDDALMRWVAGHRTPWATALADALTTLGTRTVPALAVCLVFLAVVAALRWWRPGAAAVLGAVAAVVVTEVAKHVVQRPRPPEGLALVRAGGYAMPSTDGALTAAAATALIIAALAAGRRAGQVFAGALLALTVVIGIALVYVGAHWATDVLAGWAIGVLLGIGATRLLRGQPPG